MTGISPQWLQLSVPQSELASDWQASWHSASRIDLGPRRNLRQIFWVLWGLCWNSTVCHWTQFSPLFLSIFDPTSSLSLTNILFFLMFISLCFTTLMNRWQEHIWLVTTSHQYHNLLGYLIPETVPFLFNHPILCWDSLGHPCLLPELKVLDFPDMEHE